ncbi:MAG: hypothetical protein JWP89_4047 [Schlesneria sp.]|nr:hypothetical protein [Schlesneria sp.]
MSTRATETKWRSCLAVALIFVAIIAVGTYVLRPPISNRILLVEWGHSSQCIESLEIQFTSWKWRSTTLSAGGPKGRITILDFPHQWTHGDMEVTVHIVRPSGRTMERHQLRSHGRGGHQLCVELHDDGSVDVGWDKLQGHEERGRVEKTHVEEGLMPQEPRG